METKPFNKIVNVDARIKGIVIKNNSGKTKLNQCDLCHSYNQQKH